MIYKVFQAAEWAELQASGQSAGAPIDVQDGYVHFSTAVQLGETLAKHFAGAEGLVLLAVDEATLGEALKWEVSRGGQDFPHLYRELRLTDVVSSQPLALVDGGHVLPDDL